MGETTTKPYYRNLEDTLEDVGITARQLGYWRKQGLFQAELGIKSKYFTQEDTDRLRFLKSLIDGLGLPIATVKALIDSVDPDYAGVGLTPTLSFIDTVNAKLVHPASAINQLLIEEVAHAGTYVLEKWLQTIALLLFRKMRVSSKSPEVYEAQRKELLGQIARADLMARIFINEDGSWFSPKREGDPTLPMERAQWYVDQRQKLMQPILDVQDRDNPFPF